MKFVLFLFVSELIIELVRAADLKNDTPGGIFKIESKRKSSSY